MTDLPGQDVSVEVMDKDMDMKDDFMGRYITTTMTFISFGL